MSIQLTCSRYCGGNVKPMRFVKQDTVRSKVLQATDGAGSAGDPIFGVSQDGTWQPPVGTPGGGTALDDGYAGIVGSPPITVFMAGAETYILSGAAFAQDDFLKSDSDGRAITASSGGDNIGAIALEPATAANQKVKVRVVERKMVR